MKISLVPVVIGVVVALLAMIGLVIVVVLRFCPYRRQDREDTDSQLSNYTQEDQLKFESSVPTDSSAGRKSPRASDNNSPDLIPANNEGEYQLKELRVLSMYNDIKLAEPSIRYTCAKPSNVTMPCMISPKFCNTDPRLIIPGTGTLKKCINRPDVTSSQDVSNFCSTYPSSSGSAEYQRTSVVIDISNCSFAPNISPPPPPFQDANPLFSQHLNKPIQMQCCQNLRGSCIELSNDRRCCSSSGSPAMLIHAGSPTMIKHAGSPSMIKHAGSPPMINNQAKQKAACLQSGKAEFQ